MKDLGKVLITLPTPFDDDFNVDYKRASNVAKKISSFSFVDSIIAAATAGEFVSMSFDEKIKLFKTIKEAIGEKPLIAGTGAITTKEAIDTTNAAKEVGIDVAMITPPYYLRPSQEEIYNHFKAITENTDIPIMIYNVVFASVNIEPETVSKISKLKNVYYMKEIGTNPLQVAEVVENTPEDFKVYSGSVPLLPCILAQGGVGVVCEVLVGEKARKLIDYYLSGDIRKGLEIYFELMKFFKIYKFGSNPVPVLKYAMNLAGYDVGKPRPPLAELNEKQKETVKEMLKNLNMI